MAALHHPEQAGAGEDVVPPLLHYAWLHSATQAFSEAHYACLVAAIKATQPMRVYCKNCFCKNNNNNNFKFNSAFPFFSLSLSLCAVYTDIGKLDEAEGWLAKALALDRVSLVRVTLPLSIGGEAVRHPAHAARLLTLLGLSAVGGTVIDADALLLRDWPPEHASGRHKGGKLPAQAMPAARVLWRDNALPLRRASLGWLAARPSSPFVWRLWAASLAVYETYSWDAQFVVSATVLADLFPGEVLRVDGTQFDGGVERDTGKPSAEFFELLESTGQQFEGAAAVRLHAEAVADTGMSLPSWQTQPAGGVRSSLLCETRAHVVPLTRIEQLFYDARWAFRSRRFVDATSLFEQYLAEAEPRHVPHASLFDEDFDAISNDSNAAALDTELTSADLPSRPDRERAYARILLVCIVSCIANKTKIIFF